MKLDVQRFHGRIILTDGDFSQELRLRGWPAGAATYSTYLDQPDQCRAVCEAFLRAGADLILTATDAAHAFASTPVGEDDERLHLVNRSAARISRQAVEAVGGQALGVVGVMGPPAAILSVEDLDRGRLADAFRRQAGALAEGGVDMLLCRSFSELDSLQIAVEAAMQTTGLPVIGSLRFDSGADRSETTLGVSVAQVCEGLAPARMFGIGCDAAEDSDAVPQLVQRIRQLSNMPIWVGLNAGWPEWTDDGLAYTDTPEKFATRLRPLVEAGATVIGGRAGATVDHIAAMAAARARLEP